MGGGPGALGRMGFSGGSPFESGLVTPHQSIHHAGLRAGRWCAGSLGLGDRGRSRRAAGRGLWRASGADVEVMGHREGEWFLHGGELEGPGITAAGVQPR